jgi:hypothetical protein
MTAIYVLTCPRPPEEEGGSEWPYVLETCKAIEREDLPAPHFLFVDGDAMPADLNVDFWRLVNWERPHMALRGNKLPYWAVLEHALEGLYDDVIVLEDDLKFCANAVRRMLTFPVPADVAFVQFFAPHINLASNVHPGLWRPPLTSQQFTQAIKYPARTLRQLLEWSDTFEFGKFVESDQALNLASTRLGLRYAVHAPDLVDHVGASSATVPGSTVGETSGRISQCFPDEGFDALRLYDLDLKYR